MRWSLKIAATAFLTYLVFGLANLLGPMKSFVPFIYFDTFFIPICALLFLYRLRAVFSVFAIAFLAVSFLLSGYVEFMGPTELPNQMATIALYFLIIAIAFHAAEFLFSIREIRLKHQFFWIIHITLVLLFGYSMLAVALGRELPGFAIYAYWASGFVGAIWMVLADRDDQPSEAIYRFVLLISLSSLFDFINYLALCSLSN